ncbi:adenylate/guanylate cyclase domain-containing protein [Mesorhizobium sp.]|uniref:ATP-binding protein n=1 Tax=Mesorhizobium sp. TaxID=1871066 RepID=UPI000FE51B88|nr:adenylate/guanylate cyclase domain-containing protein [Mesorhizobium sp.]RWO61521.1 MAG: adenylate/guanylate cyclase domain-containing protein [Mesorhizobium sp.]
MAGPEPEQKPAQDVRKTITILFADIVDSSRLSLTLDPEALQNLLARYFDEMSSIIQRHGGIVERYVGDEIMAAFGVPMLHEDDALRAVSAAVEMRDTLATLNHELETVWGVQLAHRIGLNTGEVFTGADRQGHRFLTGEAVRIAKRLQEAAAPNEILIGEATHKLVGHAVVVKSSSPRALKHGEKFPAIVVVNVIARAAGFQRRFEAPFVGRKRQRARIETIFRRDVFENKTCRLLTVLGEKGVGKSRLVSEFAGSLSDDVIVARGRCLPYGEGITYWPLADIIRDITGAEGVDPRKQSAARIAESLGGGDEAELIAERVAELLGFGGQEPAFSEETFWAVRRLFEVLAGERPLVIVVDDLHWAESTFLDLIEYVVDISVDFPIMIVGMAREELLKKRNGKKRKGWGAGKPNATTIKLEPLSEAECHEMISNLLDHVPLSPAVELKITSAAEGNPFFVEELVAMLVDEELITRKENCWVARSDLSELPVPSTISALLAVRLEGLPVDERAILTTAAVEGAVFHRSAVAELARPALDPVLDDGLLALVHRDLIRQDASDPSGEEAYRFRHVLIRDAAYNSLSKNVRADLHERFAAWLEMEPREHLRESDEIVGYHLEKAIECRSALKPRDSRVASLRAQAAARFEAAARRAFARGHRSAAIALLQRVCELLSEDSRQRMVLPELAAALIECGRLAEAEDVLGKAEKLAAVANDERAASHVLVQQHLLRLLHVEKGGIEEAARATGLVIPEFERFKDSLGLCHARRLEALFYWNEARAEAAAEAWKRAAVHAMVAGNRHLYNEILTWIASSLWFGPTPADEGIRRCELMREDVRESPESEAAILRHLGGLQAMVGRFDLARQLLATSNAVYADLEVTLDAATSQNEAVVELLAGNPDAAEESLRKGYLALQEMGDRMFLPTTAAFLARAVLEQGRDEEAEDLAKQSAELAAKGDLLSQILWRGVRARVLARRAQLEEAEALASEAVVLAEATDFINHRADALMDLSHVFKASGRRDEAVNSASEALRLYQLKRNLVSASATRLWLEG